ncbi:hypothetical protein Glove_216g185 [Diversispora epigaea]|uniref:RING-CH-type domain-containing protein n=1 Tax=Diversispora epigaea TaxID=1348612 RepID=A0A397IJX5_9GLOM|nr:hypothetical protein Glove_216g185 [Diversispora epigaea]
MSSHNTRDTAKTQLSDIDSTAQISNSETSIPIESKETDTIIDFQESEILDNSETSIPIQLKEIDNIKRFQESEILGLNLSSSSNENENSNKYETIVDITQDSTTKVTKKPSLSTSSYAGSQHSMSHGEYILNSKNSYRENTDDSQGPIISTKFCKICQESELVDEQEDGTIIYEKGKLISPCKCKGSLQYVHLDCLNKWRTANVRPDASYQCEVCKYDYKFYRPKLARIVGSKIFLHFLSIISFLVLIYGISWIIKVFDIYVVNKDKSPNHPGWKHVEILGVEVIHLIIGLSLVSFLGLIFLIITSCFVGARTTRDTYCYCGGCECISCYGCLWFGDCGGGGDFGGFVLLLAVIVGIFMFIIGIFVALCTGYLLTQKISNIYLDRIKEKILEVEKDV